MLHASTDSNFERGDGGLHRTRCQDHRSWLDQNCRAHQQWAAQLLALTDAYLLWKMEVCILCPLTATLDDLTIE